MMKKDDEKGPMKSETTIFVTPLQEADDNLSEEDSADEDCTAFDRNILGESYCVLKQKLIDRVQHLW